MPNARDVPGEAPCWRPDFFQKGKNIPDPWDLINNSPTIHENFPEIFLRELF
jgi:hypothetical protein